MEGVVLKQSILSSPKHIWRGYGVLCSGVLSTTGGHSWSLCPSPLPQARYQCSELKSFEQHPWRWESHCHQAAWGWHRWLYTSQQMPLQDRFWNLFQHRTTCKNYTLKTYGCVCSSPKFPSGLYTTCRDSYPSILLWKQTICVRPLLRVLNNVSAQICQEEAVARGGPLNVASCTAKSRCWHGDTALGGLFWVV